MRILIVSTTFPPAYGYGGPPVTAFGKAKALQQLGNKVLVVTTNANGGKNLLCEEGNLSDYNGIPTWRCQRWRANRYFFSAPMGTVLAQYARAFDIALVQGNWSYVNWIAARIFTDARLPFCLYPEGSFDPWAQRHHGLRKALYWKLIELKNYQQAAGIVALTADEAEQVSSMGISSPIEVIPNGIFLQDCLGENDEQEPHYGYSYLRGQKVVVYMGRLHEKKGIDVLIRAFALHSKPEQQSTLVIAGGGSSEYAIHLRNLVTELDLDSRVVFLPPVSGTDKISLLHRADVFALPSFSEGFSMAVLEAMGCATPVVITPACHFPQVQQQNAGIIVQPQPEAVSQALSSILSEASDRLDMGKRARLLVQREFTWDRVADKTLAFCNRILKKKENR